MRSPTEIVPPTRIRLEATSFCQLKCPSCPTASGAIDKVVGRGYLKPENFSKLLDLNPRLESIELSNYGEVFLNPKLTEIFKLASDRKVQITILNGANLNVARDEALEGLVKYRISALTCSIDGATNETYAKYRVGGNFQNVINNIVKINEHKSTYQSDLPRLRWQFVIFGHNEHEIDAARQVASDLNMEFHAKLNWDPIFSPVKDKAAVIAKTGLVAASREDFLQLTGANYASRICDQLWGPIQINWDGKVLGCCANFWGDFGGSAFETSISDLLLSEKMSYAREMLSGNAAPAPDVPCSTCDKYLETPSGGGAALSR